MGKKTPKADYDVGYGKPPEHTQFKKGQSGNPSGKKKGTQDLQTLIQRIGAELVTIIEGGVKKKIQKNEAVAKAVYSTAMKGDIPASRLLMAMSASAGAVSESAKTYELTDADLSTLKRHADWVKLLEEAQAEGVEADNDQGS